MSVLEKLDKIITDQNAATDKDSDIEEFIDGDDEIMEKMFDFITSLDSDQITEDQADEIFDILDLLDSEDINEVFKKRTRRDLSAARERRREFRRKRAQIKIKARKYRRSAKGKKTLRKAKRFGKIGRTSTMKRQRTFIGPKLSKLR